MNSISKIINRNSSLLSHDMDNMEDQINEIIQKSKFLVIGGGGSIGQSVAIEIFKRNPNTLHIIDINENSTVELVRNLRSSCGYISGDFKTFIIDSGSLECEVFLKNNNYYDFVFNLSALKHVRSERDPYTLMRMIEVNILNTIKTIDNLPKSIEKYFAVSTDKATNPVNMMGASKRIMELFLMQKSEKIKISTARFANVAFSDGSLLNGFNHRFIKNQPISAPKDVKRFFLTPEESGQLCLMSGLFGDNKETFFPKENEDLRLTSFVEIVQNFLETKGFEIFECKSEDEARKRCKELIKQNKWPCYFFESDTTGEKEFEEFYESGSEINLNKYRGIGVIKNNMEFDVEKLHYFLDQIFLIKQNDLRKKEDLVKLFEYMLPEFKHIEVNKNLDEKM